MPNNPSSTVLKAVPNAGDDTIARLLMRNAREYGNDIAWYLAGSDLVCLC